MPFRRVALLPTSQRTNSRILDNGRPFQSIKKIGKRRLRGLTPRHPAGRQMMPLLARCVRCARSIREKGLLRRPLVQKPRCRTGEVGSGTGDEQTVALSGSIGGPAVPNDAASPEGPVLPVPRVIRIIDLEQSAPHFAVLTFLCWDCAQRTGRPLSASSRQERPEPTPGRSGRFR